MICYRSAKKSYLENLLIFITLFNHSLLGFHFSGGSNFHSTSKLLVQKFKKLRRGFEIDISLDVFSIYIAHLIYQACCQILGMQDSSCPWRLRAASVYFEELKI